MDTAAIAIFIYLIPSIILLMMSKDILDRNRKSVSYRLAFILILNFAGLFFAQYLRFVLPASSLPIVDTYAIAPLSRIVAGIGMHLYIHLCGWNRKLSRWVYYPICYVPLTAIIIHSILGPLSHIEDSVSYIYAIVQLLMIVRARKQAETPEDKKKFEILMWGMAFSFVWGLIFGITSQKSNEYNLWMHGIFLWAVAVRYIMVKYNFMPPYAQRYETLFKLSPNVVLLVNDQTQIIESNPRASLLFGRKDDQLRGTLLADFLSPDERTTFIRTMKELFQEKRGINDRELKLAVGTGREKIVMMDCEFVVVDEKAYQFVILDDITQQKHAEEQIAKLAYHDTLTGLPNRRLFHERLDTALAEAGTNNHALGIMLLDLDRFKLINDSLGHQTGDLLLVRIAELLVQCVRSGDMVARLGGDEFIILMPFISTPEEMTLVADRILGTLKQPIQIADTELFVSPSIGISMFPKDGTEAETLIKFADISMYQAKDQGGNQYQLSTLAMNRRAIKKHSIDLRLRKAIERSEFLLCYQPQIELETGSITGMEALIRWHSPDLGMVMPAEFIPVAEENGIIAEIDRWVLRTACMHTAELHRMGHRTLTVSVNISGRQFEDRFFPAQVRAILAETGLDPERLCLEITESAAIRNIELSRAVLAEMIGLGVGIAIDDFGIGYSSLSMLEQLQIHTVKIDRSFIQKMPEHESPIVDAIIAISRSLKLNVIAEGVETAEQYKLLRERGCNQVQGYLISRPVSLDEFEQWLRSFQKAAFLSNNLQQRNYY